MKKIKITTEDAHLPSHTHSRYGVYLLDVVVSRIVCTI